MTWLPLIVIVFTIVLHIAFVNVTILLEHVTPHNTVVLDKKHIKFTHGKGKADISWGLTFPENTNATKCRSLEGVCLDFGVAKLLLQEVKHCQKITWTTNQLSHLKDCVILDGHWYGGGEQTTQPWPIEKVPRPETPYVTADMLQNREQWYGGVSEAYWVSSRGLALKVDEATPFFFSLPDDDNDGDADRLCMRAARELPYATDPHLPLTLSYFLCSGDDVKEVHERTFPMFFSAPKGIPDSRMLEDPVWSTWAEYKEQVNESKVREFVHEIKERGFNNSQVEIDDNWETCYGDHVFNPDRFPDPKELVDDLHAEGFRVTLWIHPFINDNCDSFQEADQNGYLIKDSDNVTRKTSWWQGKSAGLVDFTNPSATDWWTGRLKALQALTGIDAFKFDAGETSYMPKTYVLNANQTMWPNVFTQKFVETVSIFGDLIETRVGRGTQEHPVFVRMLDKDSLWGEDNGLRTLVPSLLHFGLLGYPYVLPDMIGGNSYNGLPSEELFLRWAQANTFMPALQFSILPWRYGEKMAERCKEITSLHKQMAPLILRLAQEATVNVGTPVMRPTWWLCPKDENCLTADQQFLLGNTILVAPIVYEGATTLEVVLPPGAWRRVDTRYIYHGPRRIVLYDITIDTIVYFTKETDKEL